jgi:hypothetical protein
MQASLVDDVTKLIALAESAGFAGQRRAHEELKAALTALGSRLREAFALHERGLQAVRLRGELLWWHQSRYSPSLKSGYDELGESAHVAVAAAVDLHEIVPTVAPVAAEHVLSQLVRASSPTDTLLNFSDLANYSSRLTVLTREVSPDSLLTAVSAGRFGSVAPALVTDGGLKPERAAVLLFRDLQAAAAVAGDDAA